MKYDVLTEDFGGDTQVAFTSAKNNMGIEDLLDKVLIQVGGISFFFSLHKYELKFFYTHLPRQFSTIGRCDEPKS